MRLLTAGSLVRVQLEEPEETGFAAAENKSGGGKTCITSLLWAFSSVG